jgi:hypothetical protein
MHSIDLIRDNPQDGRNCVLARVGDIGGHALEFPAPRSGRASPWCRKVAATPLIETLRSFVRDNPLRTGVELRAETEDLGHELRRILV